MADPFVAEVRMFPFTFAPKGWAFCDGQLMPISQNTALFSLLGTYYGGDGKSNFGLPNLQGSSPIGTGQGQGLSERYLGETGGSQTVTLIESEMPSHTHAVNANNLGLANLQAPAPTESLARSTNNAYLDSPPGPQVQMAPQALSPAGGDAPHNNMQPYLALNFCIAMQGVYPPRG